MVFLHDKSGAWSPEKIAAFAGALVPALWIAFRIASDDLGARPVTEVIHFTGQWAVRFLWITLAISPARRVFAAPRLINARRILGVTALAYALVHLCLYVIDQNYDLGKVASEIALRFYLTIGFATLLGLAALGVTSTDAMIRRLGPRWNTLHRIVYALAIVANIHFMLQAKSDVSEPTMMAGLLAWLFLYRLLQRYVGPVTLLWRLTISIAAALLTALIEAGWYAGLTGIDPWRVLSANLSFAYSIRPAWWVLFTGLGVTLGSWLWGLRGARPQARRRAPPAPARA
jgi:sulfoxide reductase heme-binding subunit YedZ